jgi:hypothetical protein
VSRLVLGAIRVADGAELTAQNEEEFNYSQRSKSLGHQTPFDTTCKFGTQIAFPVLAHTRTIFSEVTAQRSRGVSDRARSEEYDLLHSKTRLTCAAARFQQQSSL